MGKNKGKKKDKGDGQYGAHDATYSGLPKPRLPSVAEHPSPDPKPARLLPRINTDVHGIQSPERSQVNPHPREDPSSTVRVDDGWGNPSNGQGASYQL